MCECGCSEEKAVSLASLCTMALRHKGFYNETEEEFALLQVLWPCLSQKQKGALIEWVQLAYRRMEQVEAFLVQFIPATLGAAV